MLQSKLNGGLFKIGLHHDGFCNTCGVIEDNLHFLTECTKTEELRNQIKTQIQITPVKWSYNELTSNKEILDLIVKFIIAKNIDF